MAVVKCPRCEINFMRDDEGCCSVCLRELRREKGKKSPEEDMEMCVECGLAPAVTKEGLCALCAADMMAFAPESAATARSESDESTSDNELDIISLELVEDEDEDDLLDIDLDFADEDDDIEEIDGEDDMEMEDAFEDDFSEPSAAALHMVR